MKSVQYCDASYIISNEYLHGGIDENDQNLINFSNDQSIHEIDSISISD